ncbi:MAG: methylisocitrate lyase [Bacteroidales bacterium]|nr:methylisocitrate lyase [Bacteroidales bacterium]
MNTVHSASTPGRRLRDAWTNGVVLLPGVFSPLVARLAERIGFQAVYLSGGALSASQGVPDIGLLGLAEFAEEARRITQTCTLPLVCDADTGFGDALNVERTIRVLESAGAAAVHLEDQLMPKRCGHLSGKSLVEPAVMAAKIRAAVAARRDPNFIIIARTDARGVTSFADAVARAQFYADAGADMIFPEALESSAEFEQFAHFVPRPLLANMTEFGKSPHLNAATLGQMGYRLILFPLTAFRVAMQATENALIELHSQGDQLGLLSNMMTRAKLYDRLGYTGYEERDREYFGNLENGS